jgi:hypothetical protein
MLDVPASLAHFHARQRPAAHKHAHSQHTLQGEGTQAGGWGVGVPDCTFFEPGGRSQRGRVASSAPSARRARPYINLRAGGRQPRQFGCRRSSQRRPRAVSRAARARQGRGGYVLTVCKTPCGETSNHAVMAAWRPALADSPIRGSRKPSLRPKRFCANLHFAKSCQNWPADNLPPERF